MPLSLAKTLISKPSITPNDEGCQALIAERLRQLGFHVQQLDVGNVKNLWATYGEQGPIFCFAGHTDVVPPGELCAWDSPPFEPTVRDGYLFGRGAADMKGAIAAMLVALERFLAQKPRLSKRLALLITSDEEGPATEGTVAALAQLKAQGTHIEYCCIGEPSASERVGDVIKPGRRGSFHAELQIEGIQGHVAYPDAVKNPITLATKALDALCHTQWDTGNALFPPTSFQITRLESDSGAENVTPPLLSARMNWRFSPESTPEQLEGRTHQLLESVSLPYTLNTRCSAHPFMTPADSPMIEALQQAIVSVCGSPAQLSTSGGTSDGRFFAPLGTAVVECGLVNETIHQINECARVEDIEKLSAIYQAFLEQFTGAL